MLYIENLCKRYRQFVAVSGLTLHVPKGDLFGFVGPNGAGKTTTIRMICGLLKPDMGSVHIGGYELRRQSEQVRRQIGYVPDFFGVYDNLKVKEYMEFYGSIYGLSDTAIHKLTGELLELVNLSDKPEVYVDTLSRGMKQRLCVARALLHNPELLILDEPSSGLDPRARVEMKELLMNLNSMGKTIIISSHILSEIAEMCNSVGIMNRGCLVTAGKMEDIMGMGRNEHHLIININSNIDEAVAMMREIPEVQILSVRQNEVIINCDCDDAWINRMLGGLMMRGVLVGGFKREETSLETLFMQLTSGQAGIPGGGNSGYMSQPVMQQPMGMPVQPMMQQPMGMPVQPMMQQPAEMPAQQPVVQQPAEAPVQEEALIQQGGSDEEV